MTSDRRVVFVVETALGNDWFSWDARLTRKEAWAVMRNARQRHPLNTFRTVKYRSTKP